MVYPDLRQFGEYCFEAPDSIGEHILRKDLFAVQGVVPSGPIVRPPAVTQAIVTPLPLALEGAPTVIATGGKASGATTGSGKAPVPTVVKAAPVDPGLGACTTYGKYGCVGKQPAICDHSGGGPGSGDSKSRPEEGEG